MIAGLAEHLAGHGLAPSQADAAYIRGRVLLLGEAELRRLVRATTPCSIDQQFSVSRLGFGYALTEFALAPLGEGADLKPVFSLGALANLIVTLFDVALDAGGIGTSTTVTCLITEYYKRLRTLAGEEHPCTQSLNRAIERMYEAENATSAGPKLPMRLWRRKSCLPFVVMMLPAWLTKNEVPACTYLRHLKWTYRLGRFFGGLDDAVDWEKDLVSGQPNRWRGLSATECSEVPGKVAHWGWQVLSGWDAQVTRSRHNNVIRETFLTSISQWLKTPQAPVKQAQRAGL